MASVTSIKTLTLDLPPSCLQFCPSEPEYFVIGTYYLHQNDGAEDEGNPTPSISTTPQRRSGSLIVYRLDGDDILHVTTLATPAHSILDLQWSPHPHLGDLLAVATSTGSLDFYHFSLRSTASSTASLSLVASHQIAEKDTLALSLTWSPSDARILGATLSNGTVLLCTSSESAKPWTRDDDDPVLVSITDHVLEAWCLSFLPNLSSDSSTTILSGGDDAILARTSLSSQSSAPTTEWQDRKTHFAGVTAILPLRDRPDLVVTGSYDDHIRLLHAPAPGNGRRSVLAELNLGGGVWRLRLLSQQQQDGAEDQTSSSSMILASCMHAGARILRLACTADGTWSFRVVFRFEEHESMNYASDVQTRQMGDDAGENEMTCFEDTEKEMPRGSRICNAFILEHHGTGAWQAGPRVPRTPVAPDFISPAFISPYRVQVPACRPSIPSGLAERSHARTRSPPRSCQTRGLESVIAASLWRV
nr:diphthine methyltransferase [Quercus suber]